MRAFALALHLHLEDCVVEDADLAPDGMHILLQTHTPLLRPLRLQLHLVQSLLQSGSLLHYWDVLVRVYNTV